MKPRTRLIAAAVGVTALALTASSALASGPGGGSGNGSGNNGRSQITINCANGQSYTIATSNGGKSNGAGQVVDANGHGIPASGTFTATDTTTNIVLFTGTIGNGRGHQNQVTTECTGQTFSGTVADLGPPPAGGLPPGVLPTDTVVGTVDVFVVLKV